MPIRWDKPNARWRFEFDRYVAGRRQRTSRLLPKGWTQATALAFDVKETGRLLAVATGAERPDALIETAIEHYLRDKTHLKSYRTAAEHLKEIMWAYEGKTLSQLPDVARAVNANRARAGKIETPLSDATIHQRLALLKAACRWAWRKHNICDHDPTVRMILPKVDNERHVYLSREEMLALCTAIEGREARAMVRAAFYTGMRLGELQRVRVQGDLLVLADTKNGDRRAVPIHPRIRCLLGYLPLAWPKGHYQHQFRKACRLIGWDDVTIHDLRHSTASEMVNAGVDLYTVGQVLGHRDARSTQRYSHLTAATLTDAVSKVGQRKKVPHSDHAMRSKAA